MKETILSALRKLDPAVDSHWNADGNVSLNTVKFMNNGVSISREQIEEVVPGFCRDKFYLVNEQPSGDDTVNTEESGQLTSGTNVTTVIADWQLRFKLLDEACRLLGQVDFGELKAALSEDNVTDEDLDTLGQCSAPFLDAVNYIADAQERIRRFGMECLAYASEIKERRAPKVSHADLVRDVFNANAPYMTQQSRQRHYTPMPPLKK